MISAVGPCYRAPAAMYNIGAARLASLSRAAAWARRDDISVLKRVHRSMGELDHNVKEDLEGLPSTESVR